MFTSHTVKRLWSDLWARPRSLHTLWSDLHVHFTQHKCVIKVVRVHFLQSKVIFCVIDMPQVARALDSLPQRKTNTFLSLKSDGKPAPKRLLILVDVLGVVFRHNSKREKQRVFLRITRCNSARCQHWKEEEEAIPRRTGLRKVIRVHIIIHAHVHIHVHTLYMYM